MHRAGVIQTVLSDILEGRGQARQSHRRQLQTLDSREIAEMAVYWQANAGLTLRADDDWDGGRLLREWRPPHYFFSSTWRWTRDGLIRPSQSARFASSPKRQPLEVLRDPPPPWPESRGPTPARRDGATT